jgi:hypothetical protein
MGAIDKTASDDTCTKEVVDEISIQLHDTRQEAARKRETFSELPGSRVVSRKQAPADTVAYSRAQYRA